MVAYLETRNLNNPVLLARVPMELERQEWNQRPVAAFEKLKDLRRASLAVA